MRALIGIEVEIHARADKLHACSTTVNDFFLVLIVFPYRIGFEITCIRRNHKKAFPSPGNGGRDLVQQVLLITGANG